MEEALSVGATAVMHILHYCSRHIHGDEIKALSVGNHVDATVVREQVRTHTETLQEMAGRYRHCAHLAERCRQSGQQLTEVQRDILAPYKRQTHDELVVMARCEPVAPVVARRVPTAPVLDLRLNWLSFQLDGGDLVNELTA